MHAQAQDVMDKGIRILEQNKSLRSRLKKEQKELIVVECSEPKIGRYLLENELSALVDIFQSSQACFNRHFPGEDSFRLRERKIFAKQLEQHATNCHHCKTKVLQDDNWEKIVDSAFQAANS